MFNALYSKRSPTSDATLREARPITATVTTTIDDGAGGVTLGECATIDLHIRHRHIGASRGHDLRRVAGVEGAVYDIESTCTVVVEDSAYLCIDLRGSDLRYTRRFVCDNRPPINGRITIIEDRRYNTEETSATVVKNATRVVGSKIVVEDCLVDIGCA